MARPALIPVEPGIYVDDQKRHWVMAKVAGKPLQKLVGTKTAAKAYLQKKKEEARMGRLFPENARSREENKHAGITLAALCARYREEDELHNKTAARHKATEEEWIELLGRDFKAMDLNVELLTTQQATWRRKGVAPATINRKVARLRRVLELGVRDRILRFNPIYGLARLPEPNGRTRTLAAAEEARLRKIMPEWAWLYVEFALLSGFRQEEQFECETWQVSLEYNQITLDETKSGYPRTIPMSKALRAVVDKQMAIDSSWLFPNRSRKNHDRPNNFIRRWFEPALEMAGIHGLTWHDLRRTCGTRLHVAGEPVGMIQEYLGHRSSKTTDRYLAMAGDHLRRMVRVQDIPKPENEGMYQGVNWSSNASPDGVLVCD